MNEDIKTETEKFGEKNDDREIELIDLIRVIWKWKYLILLGTVVCGLIAAIVSLKMDKIYRIDMYSGPQK